MIKLTKEKELLIQKMLEKVLKEKGVINDYGKSVIMAVHYEALQEKKKTTLCKKERSRLVKEINNLYRKIVRLEERCEKIRNEEYNKILTLMLQHEER